MSSKYKKKSALTLAQLLMAVIIIGISIIVGGVNLLIFRHISNSHSLNNVILKTKIIVLESLLETENKNTNYILEFKNNSKGVQYLTPQNRKIKKWQTLSNNTNIKINDSKIIFNSKGNLISNPKQLYFEANNQSECLVFDNNLKNIIKEENTKCEP